MFSLHNREGEIIVDFEDFEKEQLEYQKVTRSKHPIFESLVQRIRTFRVGFPETRLLLLTTGSC
jgi:hypothetical protein